MPGKGDQISTAVYPCIITTGVVVRSIVSVCAVSVCNALTFESLNIESSFLPAAWNADAV